MGTPQNNDSDFVGKGEITEKAKFFGVKQKRAK